MKNILVLAPEYPADDLLKESTPVVHYFTREWVKLGYNVVVMHYIVNFPEIVYLLLKPFARILSSKMASAVRMYKINGREYVLDGVKVCRIPLLKFKPHTRYRKNEIERAYQKSIDFCQQKGFTPDIIVSHWVNPCFEMMHLLKTFYKVPTCFVSHDAGHDLLGIYKDVAEQYIKETDLFGYRSKRIKYLFEKNFSCANKPNFMCYSGVPEQYILDLEALASRKNKNVKNFVFVGTLFERKHPAEIIPALKEAFGDDLFRMSYIGRGHEELKIKAVAKNLDCESNIELLGYLERGKVQAKLKEADVFVMISERETYGLVYLEAMAAGCITIASKNEGFDGIIEDGVNGFLCEAGNSKQLASIIKHIRKLDSQKLSEISCQAIKTAKQLTDENVAKCYLKNLEECYSACPQN